MKVAGASQQPSRSGEGEVRREMSRLGMSGYYCIMYFGPEVCGEAQCTVSGRYIL